ncbi:STAS-like domain-containing protein [Staphylococcus hominis]|uniref:STAS-like domain-containing protein n=1 Tax=Staphylococcus hominis TaxID=1290 RepID=UPI0031BBC2FE
MVNVVVMSNIVDSFVTNEQGERVFEKILQEISHSGGVTVSMKNVEVMTSSFLNSALVPLTEQYSFDWFKENVKIINAKSHIVKMIKSRIKFAYEDKVVNC